MNQCSWYDAPCWLGWLVEEIKLLFVYLYEGILNAVLAVINAIPVPDFLASIGSYSLPPEVVYFTVVFQLHFGVGVLVTSYTVRFIIRRIPVIG